MKRKWLTVFLVAALLFTSVGCDSEEPSENNLEDILNEQYGDVFSEYVEDNSQTVENASEEEHHDEETISEHAEEPVDVEPEITKYHVVDIGEFHDGLARVTVYIYDKGYWSSVASSAGYNDGYFLYGYMDIEGNLPIKPIYNSAPDKIDGIALVEIYEGVNQSRTDVIDVYGNSMLPIIGDLNAAVSYGEITNGTIWVKTVEKTIGGNINTITYYNETGKMFSFENADVVPYYSNSDKNSYSNFYGKKTLLNINGVSRIIDNTGNIYEFEAVGYEDCLIPYWGEPYNFVDIGITKYDKYSDYVEVMIHMQRPGQNIYSERSYGKIDWENKTITCVEYDEYKDALVTYEEIAESYYDYTFESMTGVDVDIIDFAESAVNDEHFTTLCVRNKDYEYFYCIYKANVYDENSELIAEKKFIVDATQDIILSNYTPRPYYNKSADEYMYSFNDGLCLAKEVASGLYGYLNTAGQWAIQPQYQKAGEFSEGYATVNGNTIIDTDGNIVLNTNN